MIVKPTRPEIDNHTLKLIVGIIALSLASLTSFLAKSQITSISESYYMGDWARNIFVGFLFAIAAFLLSYNGQSRAELVLSKLAAVAALGVALFPCDCNGNPEIIPHVHFSSAAVMFLVLTYFCYLFFKRAREKGHTEANRRATVYALCGITIMVAILTLVADTIFGGVLKDLFPRLIFYCERAGLIAFGVSWLTASRSLPVLTRHDERYSLLSTTAPTEK
jgi:hypothetical protein